MASLSGDLQAPDSPCRILVAAIRMERSHALSSSAPPRTSGMRCLPRADAQQTEAEIRPGTSAFTAAGWEGAFYPAGMHPRDFLTYYATKFNAVAGDSTFYRTLHDHRLDQQNSARFRVRAESPAGHHPRKVPRRLRGTISRISSAPPKGWEETGSGRGCCSFPISIAPRSRPAASFSRAPASFLAETTERSSVCVRNAQ